MIASKVPPGHVRAVVERPHDDALAAAATDLFSGEDPTRSMLPYVREAQGAERVQGSTRRSEQFRSGAATKVSKKCERRFRSPGNRKDSL